MGKSDCGCKVKRRGEIDYCPLHVSAPNLLAALKNLKSKYEDMAKLYFEPHADYKQDPAKDKEWVGAKTAINLAKV